MRKKLSLPWVITLELFQCQENIPGQRERKFCMISSKTLDAYTETCCSLHFADTQKPPNTRQALQSPPFASNPKAHPTATCISFFPVDKDFSSPHGAGCTGAGLIPGANSGSSTAPSPGQYSPAPRGWRASPHHSIDSPPGSASPGTQPALAGLICF